jgi:4-hydroxy-3-polyprenylbenzoate decarboxylase
MAFKNQQEFIRLLEKENELLRIKEYVNPHLEMAEITDRFSKTPGGGKALLFENNGYPFPVLMNAYGSEKRMCLALGVKHDITKLPVITCWPKDGGPFVTLPVIHTKDPITGSRNVGMYRMQVFGPSLRACTGINTKFLQNILLNIKNLESECRSLLH